MFDDEVVQVGHPPGRGIIEQAKFPQISPTVLRGAFGVEEIVPKSGKRGTIMLPLAHLSMKMYDKRPWKNEGLHLYFIVAEKESKVGDGRKDRILREICIFFARSTL